MVEVGNVVTLKNGREYLILDEETYYSVNENAGGFKQYET